MVVLCWLRFYCCQQKKGLALHEFHVIYQDPAHSYKLSDHQFVISDDKSNYYSAYHIMRNSGGGEFGKTNVICQYFTQPNSRFTKVANVSYCKFANIFLTKVLK